MNGRASRLARQAQNLCHLVQFDLYSRNIRSKDVTKIESIIRKAMKILPDLEALGGNTIHHRTIAAYATCVTSASGDSA